MFKQPESLRLPPVALPPVLPVLVPPLAPPVLAPPLAPPVEVPPVVTEPPDADCPVRPPLSPDPPLPTLPPLVVAPPLSPPPLPFGLFSSPPQPNEATAPTNAIETSCRIDNLEGTIAEH